MARKKMLCTFNGTKSQALDLMRVWKEEQAERERKQKMAAWFAKVQSERERELILSNQ